jgi:hypothetical protein
MLAGLLALSTYIFILNRAYERAIQTVEGESKARAELSTKVDALAESERAARQEQVRQLEKQIADAKFQARMSAAYSVELYAIMKGSGLNPPAPPEEMSDGNSTRSP